MIEEKVKGREIEELVKRFAGASLLSKKSEEDAIKMLRGKEVSAWKIAATLVITGIKNFDVFDIDSLARGVDSSREEMINLVESLMERHLPIKIGKDYFNRKRYKVYTPYSDDYLENWFKYEDGRKYQKRMREKDKK